MPDDGTPPVQGQGQSPWSSDIEARFTDPEVRAQVDAYLRESQQPRMTQLEQQAAQYKNQLDQAGDAINLWQHLENDPRATFETMAEQMFEPDQAQIISSALRGEQGVAAQQEAQQIVADAAPQAVQQTPPGMDPKYQAILDNMVLEQQKAAYLGELDQKLSASVNDDLDTTIAKDNIHPFILAADGDMDVGIMKYRAFISQFGTPASAQQIAAGAPPVLDGTGAAETNGVPVVKKLTMEEAMSELNTQLEANRQRPAPPTGVS